MLFIKLKHTAEEMDLRSNPSIFSVQDSQILVHIIIMGNQIKLFSRSMKNERKFKHVITAILILNI